eukprot:GHUV01033795.1.p1 GENE.GHUV01033795.1~~GHUV01033795.1.p1  ORF type:complete len:346 (+),score=186.64 GHUV01033795.1:359-1396(+)
MEPGSSPAAIKMALQLDGSSPAAKAAPAAADGGLDGAAPRHNEAAEAVEAETASAPVMEGADNPAAAAAADEPGAAEDLDMVPATQDQDHQDPPQPPAPQRFSMTPSELIYMVEWVLISELKKLPGMTADSAQKAAAHIKGQFAAQLQEQQAAGEGTAAVGQQEGAAAGAQAQQVTLLPHQVEQLKAALQDKHNKLLQEEAAWVQLRQQYSAVDKPAATPAPAAQGSDRQGDPTPAPAATGAGTSAQAAAAADGTAAPGCTPAAAVESPMGRVSAQGESTLRSVSLKVEMLTALVSKMEHLVSSAEAAARSLQVGYHNEKFKVFPHINSPAALIKSITQSQPPNQ